MHWQLPHCQALLPFITSLPDHAEGGGGSVSRVNSVIGALIFSLENPPKNSGSTVFPTVA